MKRVFFKLDVAIHNLQKMKIVYSRTGKVKVIEINEMINIQHVIYY